MTCNIEANKKIRKSFPPSYPVMKIRDDRLYLCKNGGEYQTFEAYCQNVWDMTATHARRLMSSVKVIGNIEPIGLIPVTESQARPLARLPPEQQPVAWQKAVETAPAGKVTAAHVQGIKNPCAQCSRGILWNLSCT
jgi:hypothetical protein